jgi:HAD superfamily hydrolase (TIGR01509 family)
MDGKNLKGAIFDFNGTLIDDSEFHDRAWNEISMQLRGRPFTEDEIRINIYGKNNRAIVEYLSAGVPDADSTGTLAVKKENIYRGLCLANPERFRLVPGARDFLDRLKSMDIPMAIATASGLDNVEFYIKHLGLERWFSTGRIVYDNSSFQGKPAPDFYLEASKRLGLSPRECVVFEDSQAGLKSAQNAGIGMIVALVPGKSSYLKNHHLRIDMTIGDFTEITAGQFFTSFDS